MENLFGGCSCWEKKWRNETATRLAKRALRVHSGTGRLWAMLIQLQHSNGPRTQFKVLRRALEEVPKAVRFGVRLQELHMDPLSKYFDLGRANQSFLGFCNTGMFSAIDSTFFNCELCTMFILLTSCCTTNLFNWTTQFTLSLRFISWKMRLLILLDLKSILGQVMESFPLEKWEEVVLAAVKMLLKRTQKLSHPLDMSSLKSKCYKDLQLRWANADPN